MKKIKIVGEKILTGNISISGAKNSVVALIPAAIMTSGKVTITNVPRLSDTENLESIIHLLGADIEFGNKKMIIESKNLINKAIPLSLSKKLRASYYFMGALLARFRHVEISYPGGCEIGTRPIDLHLMGFRKMGTDIRMDGDKCILDAPNLHGATIDLAFASVGATVNIMLAATMADGKTIINNVAKEPEIENIAEFLNKMGANIKGAGTNQIVIEGVKELHGTDIEVVPDRIEAGTYIIMGALAGKDLTISGIRKEHLEEVLNTLTKMNVNYTINQDSITVSRPEYIKATDIKTEVYPGFPTDLGQPITVLLTQATGISNFEETIYENRIGHYPELNKMGAKINYTNTTAQIIGMTQLKGKEVKATDLRAGACLIIAGLIASGETKITNIEYILRGYEDIVYKLSKVGADIEIIEE